jgi:hypothetical protein
MDFWLWIGFAIAAALGAIASVLRARKRARTSAAGREHLGGGSQAGA